jgi:O-antigen/teichoic acid export membrane protein
VYLVVSLFVAIPYGPLILAIAAVTILLNLFLQMARGLGRNKDFAFASIAVAIANFLATLGLVVIAGLGVQGVFLAMFIANMAGVVYLFLKLKLYAHITFRQQDIGLKKELARYALPLVPNGISWWVISLFDRTIIALFLGVASNGIYAVSSKYATIFTSLSAIFGMSWAESASVHINSKDRQAFFNDVFNASVRAFGSLGLLLIAALPIVFGLIDRQYAEAYMYIPILIIAAFFNAIVGLYSAIYVARKMTKQVMTTSLIAAAINIALNFALITFIGLYAAALATATAYFVMAVYRHFDIKSFLHISYQKQVLAGLVVLYGAAMGLYYLQNPFANAANVLLVVAAAFYLNRNIVGAVAARLKRKGVRS